MKAIVVKEFGSPEQLQIVSLPDLTPATGQVVVDVHAAALNRADLLQRRGKYPPPKGESEIIGLECAGVVSSVGPDVTQVKVGDRVMALLAGGGYAEQVVIHQGMAIPIPKQLSFVEAAAVPEAFLTAREALFTLGQLEGTSNVLIHAAAGGVGSAAVQLAKAAGATVFATASGSKIDRVKSFGADHVIDYKTQDFETIVNDVTQGKGVDVVVDFIGADYWPKHAKCLASGGRLVVVGVLGGANATVNLGALLFKRHQILGLVMRSRSLADKLAITQRFIRESLPLFGQGTLKPVVDSVFPMHEVRAAHERMEKNENVGKIVLSMREDS
ncbi:MAG: NAD(P)H-quinone oxidoreductase [Polyangiaceae bacterium]